MKPGRIPGRWNGGTDNLRCWPRAKGPGAALRRPEEGYRYFFIMLDVATRTVQLAIVHPGKIPTSLAPLLPAMPATIDSATIDSVRSLRLPR